MIHPNANIEPFLPLKSDLQAIEQQTRDVRRARLEMEKEAKQFPPRRSDFDLTEVCDLFAKQCRVVGDMIDDSELLDITDAVQDELDEWDGGGYIHGDQRVYAHKPRLVILDENGKAIEGRICMTCDDVGFD